MAVKSYSKKKDGDMRLSKNFTVREFACKDGSDKILVDTELVSVLQQIRDSFGVPVKINSGYRTKTHNRKINGATRSRHLEGRAADIDTAGVEPLKVCQYAEAIKVRGIGRYNSFVHIDTRPKKYYWDKRSDVEKAVSSFGGMPVPDKTLRFGDRGEGVKWVQQKLDITVDGIYGKKTETAVMAFQRQKGLVQDGIVGVRTRGELVG